MLFAEDHDTDKLRRGLAAYSSATKDHATDKLHVAVLPTEDHATVKLRTAVLSIEDHVTDKPGIGL